MFDKILVFGDSISYGKWDREGGWVARLRRYVDKKYNLKGENNFQVYNLGIPGELAIELPERVKSELKIRLVDPEDKVLVIYATGINDSCPNNWRKGKQTSEVDFNKALEELIKLAKDSNCEVVFIGLTPTNPERSKGLLFTKEEVRKYDGYMTEVCSKYKIKQLELFDGLSKENFSELLVDAVHPNTEGHKILSEKIIKFLSKHFQI